MPVQQLDWAGGGDRDESLSASDVPQDCDFEVDFFLENEREKNNLFLGANDNICTGQENLWYDICQLRLVWVQFEVLNHGCSIYYLL